MNMLTRRAIGILLALVALPLMASAEGERAEFWVDMALGEPVSQEEMLEDLAEADVIYLGETHRLERHHRLQLEIVRGLAETGRPVVLALEQVEARNQKEVDEFNRGKTGFDELAKAIDWKKQWNNYADYRAVVEAVRESGGRVVGANGPLEVIRAVGKKGVAGLSPEERKQLPEDVFLDDPVYEKLLETLLMVHMTMEKGFLRKVFEAQAARDDAMADAVARSWHAMAERDASRRPVAVVVCGAGHCQFGLGTPDRVRRRWPDVRDRIVLMSESGDLELTDEEKAMRRDIEIKHRDVDFINRPLADYLHAKEPAPEEEE